MGSFKAVISKALPESLHSIWFVTDSGARILPGIGNTRPYLNGIPLRHGEDLLAALDRFNEIRQRGPRCFKEDYRLEDPWIQPGGYYPRMAVHSEAARESLDKNVLALSLVSLASLVEQVKRLFGVVHPTPSNFAVYGAEIRNLLILCCTEVEAQWKGVLKAHGYDAINPRPTTKDYVRLLGPMRLDEFEAILPPYPWLKPIRPFHGWNATSPTQSLPWYDAYNVVKHDRENHFDQASLGHVITSLSAIAVMLAAQYGEIRSWHDHLGGFIETRGTPRWGLKDLFIPPFDHPDSQYRTKTPIVYPALT